MTTKPDQLKFRNFARFHTLAITIIRHPSTYYFECRQRCWRFLIFDDTIRKVFLFYRELLFESKSQLFRFFIKFTQFTFTSLMFFFKLKQLSKIRHKYSKFQYGRREISKMHLECDTIWILLKIIFRWIFFLL